MPLYSLLCEDCSNVIEILCEIDETAKCHLCGKVMKQLPIQTSFILNGNKRGCDEKH